MKPTLYSLSVTVFGSGLIGLKTVLERTKEHADAQGWDEKKLLRANLAPDMHPLPFQVQAVCDFAFQAPARLAGKNIPPATVETEHTYPQLLGLVDEASRSLAQWSPSQFDGREDVSITFPVGDAEMTLSGIEFLIGFATPNFYFHFVTAYDIARNLGVPLGKRAYFGM